MIKYYVVSHTHWDREWYQPLEVMKTRLVHLIDALLDIIGKDGEYVFHLDEQTVVIEDYLSVRPENEKILKKYIKSGNIIVGPWYLQNDFYYSSGEATVRNLQIGFELAKKFGRTNRAGYAPDNFGIISQLPQIFNGFGIDTLLFGRGYEKWTIDENGDRKQEKRKTEFIWEGGDGSRLFSSFMLAWYNNAQRFPDDTVKALKLITLNEKNFEGLKESPYLLLMNGVDHLEPQRNVREIIKELNARLGEEAVVQTAIEKYLSDLKEGMELNGTVRNVIDFGVFVDIGVHQDGLVHLSQLADRYIKHPSEVVKVGDVVQVRVLSVDLAKKRIALTMRKKK